MSASPLDGVDRLVTGSYTFAPDYSGRGVTVCRPAADGSGLEELTASPLSSPTWVLVHPDRPWVFTATESDPATVASFRLEESGELSELSVRETGGAGACHLSLTDDARFLLVSNYGSGSVSSFAVGEDGTLDGPRDLVQFEGSGPDTDRQEAPHAHQTTTVGGEVLACDLGTDRVHRLRLDETGRLHRAADPIQLPPGFGPRHLVTIRDRLVVAGELSGELWVGVQDSDSWVEAQRLPTSDSAEQPHQPSGLVTDGRTVVVATRGADTVTTFAVDGDGSLRRLAEVSCGGHWPRALTLRGSWLWVANERSDSLVVIDLADPAAPRQVREFPLASATCVELLPGRDAEIG